MLNLSCYAKKRGGRLHSENIHGLSHPELTKTKLPRHISCLESPNRRRVDQAKIAATEPKSPRDKQFEQGEAINLALSILDYQLKNNAAQQKHLENLRSNLQHRWQVAKANNNSQLMAMLQKEFRHLAAGV
ncbi:MAG: hypothetical protein AAF652_00715 [Cyanobacteria bacterium P01_C01_bin.72]